MEKFTSLKDKNDYSTKDKEDILFSNDYMKVIEFDGWSIIKESDFVVCIIYLIESNQFILRHEYIPTFFLTDGQDYHMTILSGSIKRGETPENAILREIEEEAGIVISPEFTIEFMKPLFISKAHASKYHPCIITLTERDYHEVMASPQDKIEKLSQSVKIDIKFINSVNTSDLITDYMLDKFKKFINI